MKQPNRIAVITVSQEQFERYLRINEFSEKTHKQVRILRDIQDEEFCGKELIEGSQNVTDFVINNIRVSNATSLT